MGGFGGDKFCNYIIMSKRKIHTNTKMYEQLKQARGRKTSTEEPLPSKEQMASELVRMPTTSQWYVTQQIQNEGHFGQKGNCCNLSQPV